MMIIEPERMFQLLIHFALLLVKTYSVYFLAKQILLSRTPNGKSMMFIFKPLEFTLLILGLIIVSFELYYISYFFIDVTLYSYEYVSIFDQIIFTILAMYHLKKGGANG